MTNIASDRARRMRREKGAAERTLWRVLRNLNREGYRFRQQAPLGPYIADFCDHSARLVIELDGSQHGLPVGQAHDQRRTRWLETQGYAVLRFWNSEVHDNLAGVETAILLALGHITEPSIDRPPPPCGEGTGVGGIPIANVLQSPPPCPSPTRGEETLEPRASRARPRVRHRLRANPGATRHV